MSEDLPRDLVINILSRLPLTSLLRFKSVCKSWYDLLKNPNFISKHFQSQSPDPCFLFTRYQSAPNHGTISLLLSNEKSVDVPINLNIPFLNISKPFRVSGSCNGLICLSILPLGSIILLWNPATRMFKDLPVSPIDRPPTGPIKVVLGFGFDSSVNEYKVLRIVYYTYPLNQVEVYSLSTDSWREIKAHVRFLIFESSASVFVKGRFHWTAIGFEEMNGRKIIVSFDMADETFRYIMPPRFDLSGNNDGSGGDDSDDDVGGDTKVRWSIVGLMESLAVISSNGNGPEKKFDIWVMNEYGVARSWTKFRSFQLRTRIDRPLGCGLKGEFLLEKDRDELVLYDSNTQMIKNLGSLHVACWSDVFTHVGSLLPIKGGKIAEETNLDSVIPDLFFVRKFDLMMEK